MISASYNAQYLTLDFRLLDDPSFCAFMRSPAFALYMVLRRYVWRGTTRRHPLEKVNQLRGQGFLVSALSRAVLARKLGISEVSHISRYLAELVSRGLIEKVRTGRLNAFVLGTWEDRSHAGDGSYLQEMFFLEQRHGADGEDSASSDMSRRDTSRIDMSSRDISDVSPGGRPEVSKSTHNNREENNPKKKPMAMGDPPFEPVDRKERIDDVLYVED